MTDYEYEDFLDRRQSALEEAEADKLIDKLVDAHEFRWEASL